MTRKTLSAERLREMLDYDAETGIFVWRKDHGVNVKAGMEAGHVTNKGYRMISLDGFRSVSHRLAWLYVYGAFPSGEVDHINRVKTDNRLCNLREVTRSENQQNTPIQKNNNSGYRGVSWNARDKKWRAQIYSNRKPIYLGYFDSAEDANLAYLKAAAEMHTHNPAAQGEKP